MGLFPVFLCAFFIFMCGGGDVEVHVIRSENLRSDYTFETSVENSEFSEKNIRSYTPPRTKHIFPDQHCSVLASTFNIKFRLRENFTARKMALYVCIGMHVHRLGLYINIYELIKEIVRIVTCVYICIVKKIRKNSISVFGVVFEQKKMEK